jgi:hypothetical protein
LRDAASAEQALRAHEEDENEHAVDEDRAIGRRGKRDPVGFERTQEEAAAMPPATLPSPPRMMTTKAAIVNGNPMNGEICSVMLASEPATAAVAKPRQTVKSCTRSMSTPTMAAASRRWMSALIARPTTWKRRKARMPKHSSTAIANAAMRLPVSATLPKR